MSIRLKGDTGLRLVSEERVFDEKTGFQTVATYEGLKPAVDSAMGLMSLIQGLKMSSRQVQGPWYRLTITFAGTIEGTDDPPVDTWSRVVEFVQEDIRSNPNVIALAGDDAGVLALWVKEIKEALKEGEPLDASAEADQVKIYRLYARGAEAHEQKRIVVRRRRVIPVQFAEPEPVRAVEVIYTTEQLITQFGVPVAFQELLPEDPDFAPADTIWGWRERTNATDFVPSINKTEETMEWVFAAWSTVLYDLFVG
jgi:hypothetical protein